MKARELASSGERLSSRATPTNTTCHAAELHVRPRSCRAFARRGRESSLPTETFSILNAFYSLFRLFPSFSVRPFILIIVYTYIYIHIYRYIYRFVSNAEEKNCPGEESEEEVLFGLEKIDRLRGKSVDREAIEKFGGNRQERK